MSLPGLYVHVPFCRRKCRYCDFASRPLAPLAGKEIDPRDRYLEALGLDLERLPPASAPGTVYLGGGTPTALGVRRLRRLFALLRDRVDVSRTGEWSCEANPESLTPGTAAVLKEGGVNRVSLGVQSFNDRLLAFLGRPHDAASARSAFRLLRASGFANLGMDLMFGLPGQSLADWESDLDVAVALAPEHVSVYALSVEPNTPLGRDLEAGRLRLPPPGHTAGLYRAARRRLSRAGYGHYEISNFALPGYACRHNLLYWTGGEYLACGPAAHSHGRGERSARLSDPEAWRRALEAGRPPLAFTERLDPEARARETLVMHLRLIAGLRRDAFRRQTGFDYRALRGPEIERLLERRLLVERYGRLRLSAQALFISDTVFTELV